MPPYLLKPNSLEGNLIANRSYDGKAFDTWTTQGYSPMFVGKG